MDEKNMGLVRRLRQRMDRRHVVYLAGLALLLAALGPVLVRLVRFSVDTNVYSYILLIPFITVYLFVIERHRAPAPYAPAWSLAGALVAGAAAAGLLLWRGVAGNENDVLALAAYAGVCLVLAGTASVFGLHAFRRNLFALLFLFFVMPWPTRLADSVNTLLQLGSADVTAALFKLTGTPVYRDGLAFLMPGLAIEVAEECSGIRSSLVLLITSLLAGHLFLSSRWRRVVLVLCVVPLSLLRNGIRIVSIALLTIHVDEGVIRGPLHKRGGPLFFILSLAVLFVILWLLRLGDRKRAAGKGLGARG